MSTITTQSGMQWGKKTFSEKIYKPAKNYLYTQNINGKQIDNSYELWESEWEKFHIITSLFKSYMSSTTAENRKDLDEKNKINFSDIKDNCIEKFISTINDNKIDENFFENEDLIALSFIGSDQPEDHAKWINNFLTDTDKYNKLNEHVINNPISPFKSILEKVNFRKSFFGCNKDENFTDDEIKDILNNIVNNSLNAFMDKIGEPLRDSYLSCIGAHSITETNINDYVSFLIGMFSIGSLFYNILTIANVELFNQPTENKDSYEEERATTIENVNNEKTRLYGQLDQCQNDHNKGENYVNQQRLNENLNLLTKLIEKLESELGTPITNVNLIDINKKIIDFSNVKLNETPTYDGRITSSIGESPTMEETPTFWDTSYLLNNPYVMTLISELATPRLLISIPYLLKKRGIFIENHMPGITNILWNAPTTSDTAVEVIGKILIQQGAAMGVISQGKYGGEYDSAANKNVEKSNRYLKDESNKINHESQQKANDYLSEIEDTTIKNGLIIESTFHQNIITATVPQSINSHRYQVSRFPLNNAENTIFGNNGNAHTYIPFAEFGNNNAKTEFKAGGYLSENEYIVSKGSGSILSIQSSDTTENIISAEVHNNILYIRKTFKDNEESKDTLYELNTNGKQVIAKQKENKIYIKLSDKSITGDTETIATIPYTVKQGDSIYKIAKENGITNANGRPDIDLIKSTNTWLEEKNRIDHDHIEIFKGEIINLPIFINNIDADASWSITQINDIGTLSQPNQVLWNSITANNYPNFINDHLEWNGGLNNGTSIFETPNGYGGKDIYFRVPSEDLFGGNNTIYELMNTLALTNYANPNHLVRENEMGKLPQNYYEGNSENIQAKFLTVIVFIFGGICLYGIRRNFSSQNKKQISAININEKMKEYRSTTNSIINDDNNKI